MCVCKLSCGLSRVLLLKTLSILVGETLGENINSVQHFLFKPHKGNIGLYLEFVLQECIIGKIFYSQKLVLQGSIFAKAENGIFCQKLVVYQYSDSS